MIKKLLSYVREFKRDSIVTPLYIIITSAHPHFKSVFKKYDDLNTSVQENLRWGNKEAIDEELIAICKQAQSDEFIQSLPDKYDTFIEQGGTNISGRQKQRLCIERALLKKPKILILDDSTSAVYTKTDNSPRLSEAV